MCREHYEEMCRPSVQLISSYGVSIVSDENTRFNKDVILSWSCMCLSNTFNFYSKQLFWYNDSHSFTAYVCIKVVVLRA